MGLWKEYKRNLAIEIAKRYYELSYLKRIIPFNQLVPEGGAKNFSLSHEQITQSMDTLLEKTEYRDKALHFKAIYNSAWRLFLISSSRLEEELEIVDDLLMASKRQS